MDDITHSVRDNPDQDRYELVVDGEVISHAAYRLDGTVAVVPHVETHPHHRGRGMADRLMAGMLDDLRRRDLSIRPLCGFAAGYLRDHPENADLLA